MTIPAKRSSAVANTVTQLRQLILEQEDGAYLGSEDQLMTRFGISRPTLRQAVRLMEHERLLVIKRGSGGGFFARRPQIEAVAHAATIYLSIERATPNHIFAASVPLLTEATRLAAINQSKDPALKMRLQQLLMPSREGGEDQAIDTLTFDWTLAQIVSEMCGNPVIKLFISIIYEFGASHWRLGLEAHYREHVARLQDARNQIIQAILAGDSELAMLYSQRRSELIFKLIEGMPPEVPNPTPLAQAS